MSRLVVLGLGAACVLLVPVAVRAQSTAPPQPILNPVPKKCKANSKDPACKAPPASTSDTATPSPAADNPFPVEESRHGGTAEGEPLPVAPSSPSPGSTGSPGSTNSPGSTGSPGSPAPSANGLPALPSGSDADPPAESNKPRRMNRDGYSSGSSSDDATADGAAAPAGTSANGGSSSSRANDADDDVAPTTAAPDAPVKASKLKDLGSTGSFSEAHAKLEKTRFDDDLKVGRFYMQDGNPQGAYLRFKDAVDHVPDDPDALFGLAEAANKLKKRDEAIVSYRETIKADPGGDHDKASRAALKELGVTAQ